MRTLIAIDKIENIILYLVKDVAAIDALAELKFMSPIDDGGNGGGGGGGGCCTDECDVSCCGGGGGGGVDII